MKRTAAAPRDPAGTRRRLVGAAVRLMLRQGFAATTVDQVCTEAGLTKGGFFHHFADKEALGREAVGWWGRMGMDLYSAAWRDGAGGPLAQLHGMLDIMEGFTRRPGAPCVCLVGMMSQELAATCPAMRDACAHELRVWKDHVARLLAAAKEVHRPRTDFDPEAVAWFLNSLWQGSMLIAKTSQEPALIRANLALARAFVDGLFAVVPARQRAGTAGGRRAPAARPGGRRGRRQTAGGGAA